MTIFTIATWLLGVTSVLGVGGAIVASVFFPAVAIPIIEKILEALFGCKSCLIVFAFVLSTLAAYWTGHHGEYAKGYEAALNAIAAEDSAAIQRATEKRSVWQSCKQQNGEWDQSTGSCK